MHALLLPESVTAQAGLYPRVRSGLFVSFQVKESRGDTVLVSLFGQQLRLRTSVPLDPGKSYRAQIQKSSEGYLLKLLDETLEQHRNGRSTLLLDNAQKQAAQVLYNAALPIRNEAVQRVQRLLKRYQGIRSIRPLLSLLLGKGIDPESGAVQELLAYYPGYGTGGDERRERQRREQGDRKEIDPDDLADELKKLTASTAGDPNLLRLVNSLKQRQGHWFIIPLPEIQRGDQQYQGVLRLYVQEKGETVLEIAQVSIHSENFSLDAELRGKQLRLYLDETSRKRVDHRRMEKFRKKMDNIGFQVDDIQREEWYTALEEDELPGGFDRSV